MKFALYSRQGGPIEQQFVQTIIDYLLAEQFEVLVHSNCAHPGTCYEPFSSHDDLKKSSNIDFVVSVGGDGSFIDAANLVGDLPIPIVGINTGRIGFLSGIKKDNYRECFQMLRENNYSLEKRFLLHVDTNAPIGLDRTFAVNDVTIRTTDTDTINAVTVWANGQQVNTYWGDGLIVATPTGSTAYSMSCGGPILHPQSEVLVLTPIASHSLNVRPLVIPANVPLTIEVDSRNGQYSLCLDTQRVVVDDKVKLHLRKEDFHIQTVVFRNSNFYDVIREKLLWGIDKRNG